MNGIFDSNNQGTPAVSASGTNGADGIQASSDIGGVGVRGVSTGAAEEKFTTGGTGVVGSAEFGGIGVFGRSYGVNEQHVAGIGVSGVVEGGGRGVFGQASGRDEADGFPARGVSGYSPEGVGVHGEAGSANGVGVAGYCPEGGIGVFGESRGGFAMSAQGPTKQNRDSGGWVKALVHIVSPRKGLPSIDRLFNSQPTNIRVYGVALGVLIIDFGFIVKDRFVTAISEFRSAYYEPINPNDLSQGWQIWPVGPPGVDPVEITRSPSPPVALATISFAGENLVQVETFSLRADARTSAVSYQRANQNVFVTVF